MVFNAVLPSLHNSIALIISHFTPRFDTRTIFYSIAMPLKIQFFALLLYYNMNLWLHKENFHRGMKNTSRQRYLRVYYSYVKKYRGVFQVFANSKRRTFELSYLANETFHSMTYTTLLKKFISIRGIPKWKKSSKRKIYS